MKRVQIALLLVSVISLTLYFLPAYGSPPISIGAKWSYYYREKLTSIGRTLYEAHGELSYSVIEEMDGILIVEMNRTFTHTYFSANGSKSLVFNGSNTQLFFVDPKSRLYNDGTYTSWWIPTNIFIGSLVPVWSLNLQVKGLSWTIINGMLVECWILEYKDANEEYTVLYERTLGLFIRLTIRRETGFYQTLLIERWLKDTSIMLPPQATLRPLLIIVGVSSAAALLLHYAKKARKYLSKPKEVQGPILT